MQSARISPLLHDFSLLLLLLLPLLLLHTEIATINRCACVRELLEDQPAEEQTKHFNHVRQGVYPQIFYPETFTPLLKIVNEEVVDELG
jgi:hypothetical protein